MTLLISTDEQQINGAIVVRVTSIASILLFMYLDFIVPLRPNPDTGTMQDREKSPLGL
jgi:hypothetical protein